MKVYWNTGWRSWNLLPTITIGQDVEDFCYSATQWYAAFGWGPFELEFVW